MSAPFSLSVPLRASPALLVCLLLLHLAPALSVMAPEVILAPAIGVWLAVGASFAWQLRCLRGRKAQTLALAPEAGLLREAGGEIEVDLQADGFESAWLIVLHWRERGSGRHGRAALMRDALPPDDWRRLRAHLRLLAPANHA